MDSKDKILTTDGFVKPSSLGVTMAHEHLYVETPSFFTKPKDESKINMPFNMPNLGWIRQNPYSHWPNLSFDGEFDAICDEMTTYKANGGQTIVENTTVGIARDLQFVKRVSDATGITLVSGTGFYVDLAQTESVRSYKEEQMAEFIRNDILEGDEGIKCGLIGEVGTAWPITDFERRSLRASAAVQDELGTPISIHPGRHSQAPHEAMRILLEAGGKAEKTLMSHLDRTFLTDESLLEYAKLGTYLDYDLFGIEVSHYQLADLDMPSDAQRIQKIGVLLREGYEDKVCVAHDMHTKHRLVKYGGHGYSHILVNVIPKMLKRGITQQQIDKILQSNPQTWLKFSK